MESPPRSKSMKIPAWLLGAVMVAIVMGIWYFRVGRHGGSEGYVQYKLGLMDGETVQTSFSGYYHHEPGALDVFLAAGGSIRRGANLIVAFTDRDRLLIGHNETEDPPMQLTREAIAAVRTVEGKTAVVQEIVGPRGAHEQAVVVEIELRDGTVIPLDLPASGVELLGQWASGAQIRAGK